MADACNLKDLREVCLDIISTEFSSIAQRPELEDLRTGLLVSIIRVHAKVNFPSALMHLVLIVSLLLRHAPIWSVREHIIRLEFQAVATLSGQRHPYLAIQANSLILDKGIPTLLLYFSISLQLNEE